MRSTHELVEEHRVIEGVLGALERRLQEAERTGVVPVEFLRNLVAFGQAFVDRCHHAKEERCLFPCLERRGIPRDGGPIGVMLQEHEIGRVLIRLLAERLELYERGSAAASDVLDPCRRYLDLLRHHILKENHILFPAGEAVMAEQDDAQTLRCYEHTEEETGRQDHERLVRVAEALSAEA